ncbi:hypothetical protein ACFE4D_004998, partial [Salmonella enterica]
MRHLTPSAHSAYPDFRLTSGPKRISLRIHHTYGLYSIWLRKSIWWHKIKIVLFLYAARVAGLSLNSLKTVFAISI